jgi:sulfite exporter TauE/SafE
MKLTEKAKKIIQIILGIALIVFGIYMIVTGAQEKAELEQELGYLESCNAYCVSPYMTEANVLTRSENFCQGCADHFQPYAR